MSKLASRKLWIAIISSIVMLANALWGIDLNMEETLGVLMPIVSFILGQAAVDAVANHRT